MTVGAYATPDWFGSPQHFSAGLILGLVTWYVALRFVRNGVIASVISFGVVSAAECVVELVEYKVVYHLKVHVTAYADTLADIADTLAGGLVAVVLAVGLAAFRARRVALPS